LGLLRGPSRGDSWLIVMNRTRSVVKVGLRVAGRRLPWSGATLSQGRRSPRVALSLHQRRGRRPGGGTRPSGGRPGRTDRQAWRRELPVAAGPAECASLETAVTAAGRRRHQNRHVLQPEPHLRADGQDRQGDAGRHRRHRGRAVLRAQRRRPARDVPCPGGQHPGGQRHAGWLDHHPAVCEERARRNGRLPPRTR
jgi:hypothetical protein